MMDRRIFQWLLSAVIAISVEANAVCQLEGRVEAKGLPLEKATVVISRAGSEIAHGVTRADGQFALDYPEFPHQLHAAAVTVRATAHVPDTRQLFRRGAEHCLETEQHDVVLEAQRPDISVEGSTLGLTIFIAPYTLYGEGAEVIADRFNQDLPKIVYHRILAYKSMLRVPTIQVDISVDTVDEALTAAQGEQIRRLGRQLNALGVIAGDGEISQVEEGPPTIELTSVFRTIPVYRDQGVIMQPIKDLLPAHRASPSRIAEQMHDLWGKQAVISYVLQRLSTHQVHWKDDELDALADLLIDVRNTMTEDDRLLAPLQALLLAIEKERGS